MGFPYGKFKKNVGRFARNVVEQGIEFQGFKNLSAKQRMTNIPFFPRISGNATPNIFPALTELTEVKLNLKQMFNMKLTCCKQHSRISNFDEAWYTPQVL